MIIKAKTPKGIEMTITLTGASDLDAVARVTCAKLQDARLDRHTGGMTYRLGAPKDGATHYILAGKIGIALTEIETARIDAEYHAWIESLPGTVRNRLHARREMLASDLGGILDDIRIHRERWFEAEHKSGALPDYDDAEARKAREALAGFDREHPEIKAEIEARCEADAERRLWD